MSVSLSPTPSSSYFPLSLPFTLSPSLVLRVCIRGSSEQSCARAAAGEDSISTGAVTPLVPSQVKEKGGKEKKRNDSQATSPPRHPLLLLLRSHAAIQPRAKSRHFGLCFKELLVIRPPFSVSGVTPAPRQQLDSRRWPKESLSLVAMEFERRRREGHFF